MRPARLLAAASSLFPRRSLNTAAAAATSTAAPSSPAPPPQSAAQLVSTQFARPSAARGHGVADDLASSLRALLASSPDGPHAFHLLRAAALDTRLPPNELVDAVLSAADAGSPAAVTLLSHVLTCLSRAARNRAAAAAAYSRMVTRGVVPDAKSCTDLLVATARGASAADALTLFDEMRCRGYYADAKMYDVVMRACVGGGMHSDAVRLFDEMAGAGVKPDERVYAITITGLCKLRDADRAVQVLGKMMEAGLKPRDFMYNSVLGVLVKVGRMDEALRLKDQMLLATGKKMDVILATTLMHGYCLHGEIGKALDLFDEAVRDGVTPTNVTYGS